MYVCLYDIEIKEDKINGLVKKNIINKGEVSVNFLKQICFVALTSSVIMRQPTM